MAFEDMRDRGKTIGESLPTGQRCDRPKAEQAGEVKSLLPSGDCGVLNCATATKASAVALESLEDKGVHTPGRGRGERRGEVI